MSTIPLKRIANIVAGQSPASDDVEPYDGGQPFLQGNAEFGAVAPEPRLQCSVASKIAHPGDVLLSVRAPVGAVNVADQRYGIGRGLCAVRAGSSAREYLWWYLQSQTPALRSVATGSTFEAVSAADVGSLQVPRLASRHMSAIAEFLLRETAKIDALIDKQEQLIATLREDRAATITQAVTKGLDSRGGILPSGNQEPTVHWARDVPLKRLAEVQTGLTLGRPVPPETAVTLPYLRVANVQVGRVDLTEVTDVEIDGSEVARYRLRAGDVLMTEGGDIDKLGRGCLWQGEIDPCLHQNHVFAVRCFDNLNARFLVYLLDTAPAREYFTLTAKKTTNLASTNSTTLGRFSFSVPPLAEQIAILSFLDERCSKIDSLIGKSIEMIEVLREYRSALITNAVTGKIDVRKAV